MPIIGMNYTKIQAERNTKAEPVAEVKVNIAPKINEVRKIALPALGIKDDVLNISFTFDTTFDPKIGQVMIEGNIIYRTENMKDLLNTWKKKKALPPENQIEIVNHLFRKLTILILQLTDNLGLPPILNLPRIEPQR